MDFSEDADCKKIKINHFIFCIRNKDKRLLDTGNKTLFKIPIINEIITFFEVFKMNYVNTGSSFS